MTRQRTKVSLYGTSRKKRAGGSVRATLLINYRVDNLSEMIAELRRGGVEVIGGPESHENGKFAWIMDPEGNKVELWEPMIWNEKNKSV